MENKPKNSKTWLVIVLILVAIVLFAGLVFAGFAAKRFAWGGQRGAKHEMMRGDHFGKDGFGMMGLGRTSGQITSINGNDLVIKTNDSAEVNVAIADTTSIYNQNKIAQQSDLKVNNSVMVFGRPNSSGVVQATAIIIR